MDREHLYIGGRWVAPAGGHVDVVEAATEKVIGTAAVAGPADIDVAVAAARAAQPGWAAHSDEERADRLRAFASTLKARARETATTVSRENGMPISLSIPAEGHSPAMIVGYYADLVARRIREDERASVFGGRTLVRHNPVGVVAAITPWNYPQALT
jgi:aldehyde dehydrogenase (NAD+)